MNYNSAEIASINNYFVAFNASLQNGVPSQRSMRNAQKVAEQYIAVLSAEERRSSNKTQLRNTLATVSQTREMIEDMRIRQRRY